MTSRFFRSARSRILGWSVLLLGAALAASTLATHVLLVRGMNGQVNAELSHEINEFRTLAAQQRASGSAPRGSVLALLKARVGQAVLEQDVVLAGLLNGQVVASSSMATARSIAGNPRLLARWAAVQRPASGTVELGRSQARYTAIPVRVVADPGRGVFVAAVLTGPQQAGISRTTRLQLEAGAVALLLGSALAWLAAGRVLRPVRETTNLARKITDNDLSARIPDRGGSEAGELAVTFNRMLDRLETAFAAQRMFLADVGHELRTPITVIQGNLDTMQAASPDDAETLAIATDELARMTRLVDDLLLLADAERPDFLRPAPTDLGSLIRQLAAKARALDDRPWVPAGAAHGRAILDAQRITQAVMQLAANAVAHTPPGTVVELGSAITDSTVEFTVTDRGPGIPAAQRRRVFDRFARVESRRTAGTGLGLSIVAAIAAAHGGTVRVQERDGGGAAFCLAVPFVPASGPSPARPDAGGQAKPSARTSTLGIPA
jgi:two-component system, OmpR family, sensor kinase